MQIEDTTNSDFFATFDSFRYGNYGSRHCTASIHFYWDPEGKKEADTTSFVDPGPHHETDPGSKNRDKFT